MSTKQSANTTLDINQQRVSVPLSSILVDPKNNLRMFPASDKEIDELAGSIKEQGLTNPLLVRLATDADNAVARDMEKDAFPINGYGYVLVAGFQRHRAISKLGVTSVDVTITQSTDEDSYHLQNLDENVQRKSLSPMDQAFVCQTLKDKGMKGTEIAKRMVENSAWVTGRLKFMKLRPNIQKQIHDGKIDPTFAARHLAMHDEAQQDKILADLAQGGKTAQTAKKKAKVVEGRTRKDKRGRKAKKKPVKVKKVKLAKTVTAKEESVVHGALNLFPVKDYTLLPAEQQVQKILKVITVAKSAQALWKALLAALR